MQNELEKINKQWLQIEQGLNHIESKKPNLKPHIHSLEKGLNAISLSFQRVHEGIEKRQFLIDFQCSHKLFTGPAHEEYHTVTSQLDVEFDLYISSIKTALNRLPTLVYEFFDHTDRRGIKTKSFGAFINSIISKNLETTCVENIQNILVKQGKKIDETVNSYRDKNIEHIQNPSTEYGLVTDKSGVRRHHHEATVREIINKEDLDAFKKRVESLPKGKRGNAVRIERQDGEYVYYVHIENFKKIEGQTRKGDLLGYASDGGSGHFDKHGSHIHTFTSPNLPIEEINQRKGYFSPSAFESLILLTDFLDSMVKSLIEFIETKES